MKVTVIGGGSTYTPELVKGLLDHVGQFPLRELCLMDIDAARLEVVGNFARRMVDESDAPFKVSLSENQQEAVDGAAYVLTQLRVGQMAARREDEYLGRRYGLIGQETTGVGGMAKALRTIPVILKLAEDIRRYAPAALLVNFTNPSGLVTQALTQYAPDVQSVGLCNVALNAKMDLLKYYERISGLKISPGRAHLKTLGLNHLSWHYGFEVDGQDVWPEVFNLALEDLRREKNAEFDPTLVEKLGMLPNYYLAYYYHTERKLAEQNGWPPSRAEEVLEVEKDLLRQYADPALKSPPADMLKRGGAYYSTAAADLLNAHYNDLGQVHVVNIKQNGAVPGWPADWVLEMPCRVYRGGLQPLPAEPLPPVCFGLLAQVKAYELLTVKAAAEGDYRAAYQALLTHPLGPRAEWVKKVLDDLLNIHRQYLPHFFPRE
ncbi:MAG: 6-phospho-beta-glucosidase [Anaerolineae bacterium]|nr:6-phospho-beta-glucosidase [Anaerolineae bacterium]